MSIEVKVPQLPESVADATLVTWHKAPGDIVERDESLADLETDKVVLEVPAPVRGVVRELSVKSGATVISGQLLATLEPAPAPAGEASPKPALQAGPAAAPVVAVAARGAGKTGPAARRMLAEQGLNVNAAQGSGRDGRILKVDVVQTAAVAAPGVPVVAGPGGRTKPP